MNSPKILISICVLFLLCNFCKAEQPKNTTTKYEPTLQSLNNYEVPQWYQDAKFGIWPHWGLYSVPAYRGDHDAAWYGIWMHCVVKEPETIKLSPKQRWNDYYDLLGVKTAAYHRETYGDPSEFGYHDFAPMFKAEKWDPDAWAQMALDAGAKFFCMMGVHHDGFCLYDSDLTRWDSVDTGPHRDLCGEMAKAVKARGLKFGVSNHFAWNSSFFKYYFTNGFNKGREDLADFYSNGVVDEAYMKRWWDRTRELADKYEPDLYYFDWGWHGQPWLDGKYHEKFASFFYNRAIEWGKGTYGSPEVVLNSKFGPMKSYCVYDIERGSMSSAQKDIWQTDTSISPTCWGHSTFDESFYSTEHLIATLVDIVSKNGVLMLNFGPKSDGTVPEGYYSRLMGMGKWLKVNGEAIYSTRPWIVAEEGPTATGGHDRELILTARDIRYTRSKDNSKIYATCFGLPNGKLPLLVTKVKNVSNRAKVTMLSNGKNIPFEINVQKQLILDLSEVTAENAGCEHAYSFRIEGMEIEAAKLTPLNLADAYIQDLKDIDPLPGTFNSKWPYISAIEPVVEKAHNGVKRDTNYHGKAIAIGGKKYEHGLMVCPVQTGNLGFFIIKTAKLPNISGFTTEIGIEDASTSGGSSAFIVEVYTNGKWQQIYKSSVLSYNDAPVKIDVKIPTNSEISG